jgi:hypothetical protein
VNQIEKRRDAMNTTRDMKSLLALVFKAVALGLATAVIVLNAGTWGSTDLYIVLLSIGLFSLALAAFLDRPAR